MFSVVIPLYNKENQIKKTLESVLNQTFSEFEVVIINDGSKDKSVEVVQSFDDPRIRLITQENAGVSAARNRGVRESKNEWIAFLDADDLWKNNKLEEIEKVINKNLNLNWIANGIETVKGNKVIKFLYDKEGFTRDVLDDLINGLYIQTSGIIIKRSLFNQDNKICFREGVNHSEDRELWIRLAFRFPNLYYVNKVLTSYIRDITNQSLTTSDVNYDFLKMNKWLENEINELPIERKKKFQKLDRSTNRKNLLYIWLSNNSLENTDSFFSQIEIRVLKTFSIYPMLIKLLVLKTLLKLK
ncbi:glycosyltransferase [Elizabethkingia sp. JS20170427COW]|uniref:glycosyltransferase family 2 protein n=1 Tax=Elizabethkingia sp. JS20170427COW TaxID=2583851 RepID=UPI001110BCF6|nr:glycosyltransferase [Elizabethkingia sp. JS20170427COW]QCX53674.1 glycosyltransferase [Elizabethkingia sp. JS20170427COW]